MFPSFAANDRAHMATFVALAAASAFLCYLSVTFMPDLLRVSFVSTEKITLVPGLIFGVAVAAVSRASGVLDWRRLAAVIVLTTVGWIAACDATVMTERLLSGYHTIAVSSTGDGELSRRSGEVPLVAYLAGLVGGAVGGGLTIVGLLITNVEFRRLHAWSLAWATATLAGLTYGLVVHLDLKLGFLILFGAWQVAVIVSVVRGLLPASRTMPLPST